MSSQRARDELAHPPQAVEEVDRQVLAAAVVAEAVALALEEVAAQAAEEVVVTAAAVHEAAACAARAAASKLGAGIASAAPREASPPASASGGYNVFLPASGDRQAALAAAARVSEAGFDDYLVVNTGAMANSVALGRYGSRDRAEARRAQLQAAGFPAQVQAVGSEGPAQW